MYLPLPLNAKVLAVKKSQGGAALVVAMLIVLLVASLAVSVSSDFLVLFRKVENQLHSQQAYQYLVGAEGLGRQVILADSGTTIDHRNEGWLDQPIVFANDQGQFSGQLADLQGRLNLNSLQSITTANGSSTRSANQERFIRLLQTLEVDPVIDLFTAEEIANAVFDWLDVDEIERPGGAESLTYGDADVPYRSANQLMADVSELRWVKGISAEIYSALLPHITVWGDGKININTASEQLLRSLNKKGQLSPLTAADIAVLSEEQSVEADGFSDLSIFSSDPILSNINIDERDLVVASKVFLLNTQLLFLDREYQLRSVIKRTANGAVVIARSETRL